MSTNIDYSTVSHETIYQHITGGPGSIDMVEASRGWQSVAAKLEQLHKDVDQAVRRIGTAQQGASADAATHATMALVPWLENGVAAAKAIADRISQQVDSFGHTRDNMPPPVKVPDVSFTQNPGTWMADHAVEWLPGIQTGHEQAQVEAQQAQQRAQELMNSYQGSTNDNLSFPQQFAQAPTVVTDVSDPSLLDGTGIGGSSNGDGGTGASPSGLVHPAVAHPTGAIPAHAGILPGHAAPAAPPGTTPQLASGAHQPSPAATAPQLAGGYHPGADGASLTGSGQVRPAAAAPFGPSPILTASSAHTPHGGSQIAGGGGGVMSRGGRFGPRPTPTFGEGHSQTGSSWHAGTGHSSAGSPTRGGNGFSGASLGATGSAGRGEDREHRRPSYLIEQDINAIVGELPRVAPPVIGAD
jgi:PPE family